MTLGTVRSVAATILISLVFGVFIAAFAWPFYAGANAIISTVIGEGSILDSINQVPTKIILADFISGYKQSAPIAAAIGLVALVDYLLLSQNKYTGYISGILVVIACVAIAFVFYKNPLHVLPGFALTGALLWLLYKVLDILFRIRRVAT